MYDSLLPLFERFFGGRQPDYNIPENATRTIARRKVNGGTWVKEIYVADGFELTKEYFEPNLDEIEISRLKLQLEEAIKNEDFEAAAELRDALTKAKNRLSNNQTNPENDEL